jgi:hypothetical protein
MKLNSSNNGYRLTMHRRTARGDPVITPIDLNQQVSEEVYNLVKGKAMEEERFSEKKIQRTAETIKYQQMRIRALEREKESQESLRQQISVLKGKLASIKAAVKG